MALSPGTRGMEEIKQVTLEYGQIAMGYLSEATVLIQLGINAALFLPAWLLSRLFEPKVEALARNIKGMPGLLRIIVAFLRRFEWLFYVLLLGIAYALTTTLEWPAKNF